MLSETAVLFLSIVSLSLGEPTAPGIDRTMSEGVTSLGYQIIYGDEEMTMFNEVVDEVQKKAMKSKIRINNAIKELPSQDVKCLMSADSYCSKEMKETKDVIIQAIKDDCKDCSTAQKEGAGKVIAAMMAHDPTAWKLFLTRTALQIKPEKKAPQPKPEQYREVGEPEDVISSNRYVMPGVKVRVKRYNMERVAPTAPVTLSTSDKSQYLSLGQSYSV